MSDRDNLLMKFLKLDTAKSAAENDEIILDILDYIDKKNMQLSKRFIYNLLGNVKNIRNILKIASLYGKYLDDSVVFYLNLIHDDKAKIKYIKKGRDIDSKFYIALSLEDEEEKLKLVPYLDDKRLFKLGSYISDDNIKEKLLDKIEDSKCKLDLYSYISSNMVRLKIIEKYRAKKDRDESTLRYMINYLKPAELQKKVIAETYDMSSLTKYLDYDYHKDHDVFDAGLDALPSDLSFGVEIEAEGEKGILIRGFTDKVLDGWVAKGDISLSTDSIELASPILHYNYKDLNDIYEICDLAKENNLITTNLCGGHIHFGEQYLNTVDSYLWLYYLYANMEEAFFLMSNKPYDIPRDSGYLVYARIISKKFRQYMDGKKKYHNIDELLNDLKKIYDDKHFSLNIQNAHYKGKATNKPINTIEFRGPNGQLPRYGESTKDYGAKDIILDILLYGNLITSANRLSKLPMTCDLDRLINTLDEAMGDEKVDIMLKILFKEPKIRDEFKKRYMTNKKFFAGDEYFDDEAVHLDKIGGVKKK